MRPASRREAAFDESPRHTGRLSRLPADACADYRAVLAAAPDDPSAWNNLGNALGGEQQAGQLGSHMGGAARIHCTAACQPG